MCACVHHHTTPGHAPRQSAKESAVPPRFLGAGGAFLPFLRRPSTGLACPACSKCRAAPNPRVQNPPPSSSPSPAVAAAAAARIMSLQEILSAASKAGKKLDAVSVAFSLGFLASRRLQQAAAPKQTAASGGGDGRPAFSTLAYKLNDGRAHPAIGFGTYKCGVVPASATAGTGAPVDVVSAGQIISDAVAVGYRMFDCAQFYANEADVGAALQATGTPREELFLISKVWGDNIFKGPAAVRAQLQQTLKDLRTDYLDLYLVHWPVPGKHVAAYLELERLQREGLVRSIGVSNYTPEDFEELFAGGATVVPAVNQIEINPFLHRKDAIAFFKSKGVLLQAYRSLRAGKEHDNATVARIATKYGKSAAQILGAWAVRHGYVYIPKSSKKHRMVENASVVDIALDAGDLAALDGLTTPENVAAYRKTYETCRIRDTPLANK